MAVILEVQNLSKSYKKKKAVDEVDFRIESGEAYGLLGPNGAGKSTILHMIVGILESDVGEVYIDNYSIRKNRKKAQALIGVVPQEIALYPTMSAEANLRFFGKLYGLKGSTLENTVEENLKLVGLYDRRKESIERYSGGMKRRINIAAALLHKPKLLIMDEPTVGIDLQSRSHILETVKKLQEEMGMSILYTSHYMEEVEAICDRVGIIDNGSLIAEGTIMELKEKYGNQSQLLISTKDPKLARDKMSLFREKFGISFEESKNGILIKTNKPNEELPRIMNAFVELGCDIKTVDIIEPNLEAIFLSLTGKSLRNE